MIGGFAERTVVDQASVIVIDKDIPLDLAALVACGVPAGVGAARMRAKVQSPATACWWSAAAATA